MVRLDNLYSKYLRCGRDIKRPESIKHGYGPSCYKKMLEEKAQKELIYDDDKVDIEPFRGSIYDLKNI